MQAMPRFVILHHHTPPGAARATHYDLMLEWGATLRTWAIVQPPSLSPVQLAEPLADHRVAYLDYEGPVSNNRGEVTRWDEGSYELTTADELKVVVELSGRQLQGTLQLWRHLPADEKWQLEWNAKATGEAANS